MTGSGYLTADEVDGAFQLADVAASACVLTPVEADDATGSAVFWAVALTQHVAACRPGGWVVLDAEAADAWSMDKLYSVLERTAGRVQMIPERGNVHINVGAYRDAQRIVADLNRRSQRVDSLGPTSERKRKLKFLDRMLKTASQLGLTQCDGLHPSVLAMQPPKVDVLPMRAARLQRINRHVSRWEAIVAVKRVEHSKQSLLRKQSNLANLRQFERQRSHPRQADPIAAESAYHTVAIDTDGTCDEFEAEAAAFGADTDGDEAGKEAAISTPARLGLDGGLTITQWQARKAKLREQRAREAAKLLAQEERAQAKRDTEARKLHGQREAEKEHFLCGLAECEAKILRWQGKQREREQAERRSRQFVACVPADKPLTLRITRQMPTIRIGKKAVRIANELEAAEHELEATRVLPQMAEESSPFAFFARHAAAAETFDDAQLAQLEKND